MWKCTGCKEEKSITEKTHYIASGPVCGFCFRDFLKERRACFNAATGVDGDMET